MKLYLRVHYGWLPKKNTEGVPELDQAINNALAPFGFKQTASSIDSMVRDLSFEADEFDIPADKKPARPKTTT
jgi:hypothetical protein